MYGAQGSFPRIVIAGLLLALLIEAVTLFCRFRCGLVATRDTRCLRRFTWGLRVHHGYVGVLMAVVAWGPLAGCSSWKGSFSICSMGLIVSDLVHHFLVLWPLTGSPEFDLVYPQNGEKPVGVGEGES